MPNTAQGQRRAASIKHTETEQLDKLQRMLHVLSREIFELREQLGLLTIRVELLERKRRRK